MIKPLGTKVLVRLLPRTDATLEKLSLVTVDKKRHYEGVRRGVVEYLAESVKIFKRGDVVWFRGDFGDSFGMEGGSANDGTDWRSLRASDVMAIEEAV